MDASSVIPGSGKKKRNITFLLLHFLPSPENPALQEQINEPTVLLQYASAEQSCDPEEHSSVSSKKNNETLR